MRNKTLPYPLTEPPDRLKKARLDNIALVPASLLKSKAIYQPLANQLPTGSVLVVLVSTVKWIKCLEKSIDNKRAVRFIDKSSN